MSSVDAFPLSDSEMFQQSPEQGTAVLGSVEGDGEDHDSGLSFDPQGDVEVPLASQEAEEETRARLQQALEGVADSRE